ncbi:MAG: FliM/FliN family flagellar motor switch protein [Acidobacteria bacterium]|nr:FliM/FliN family flagellar motor switch protein [Acidobacteriota bacterium]
MTRLLSQAEVDALLQSYDAEPARPASTSETPFDLRAPLVLAGERLALTQAACEKIAARLGEALSIVLISESPVIAQFAGLLQQPATTVLGTLAPSEPVGALVDAAGEPLGALSFQSELALSIVDRLQGGEGTAPDGSRALSPVECLLFETALHRLVAYLDRNTPLAPLASGGLEADPLFGRLARRGGTLATAGFRVTAPTGEAVCRLLMTPVLVARLLADPPVRAVESCPPELVAALAKVPVRVEPVITGASLRVSDVRRMRPGHVVQLDTREGEPLALRLNGALMMRGYLKKRNAERVFEIASIGAVRG